MLDTFHPNLKMKLLWFGYCDFNNKLSNWFALLSTLSLNHWLWFYTGHVADPKCCMWTINKPPAEELGAHLGWFVPERCHPSFLRPSEHESAAIMVRVTVHHWGSRHWIPEIWSAAQLRPSGEDIKIINNQKDSGVQGWISELLNVSWLTRVVRSCFCSGPARSLPSWSQSGSGVAPIGEDIHRHNNYLVETQLSI